MVIRTQIEQAIYDICRTASTETIEQTLSLLDEQHPFEKELRDVVLTALRDRLGHNNKIS